MKRVRIELRGATPLPDEFPSQQARHDATTDVVEAGALLPLGADSTRHRFGVSRPLRKREKVRQ